MHACLRVRLNEPLFAGCHLPLTYIGMEYIRTNNLTLAEQVFSHHNDLLFAPRRTICGKHMPNCCVAVSGTSSHSVQHRPTCIQRARHYSVQAMQVRKCQISQLKGSHTHTHTHTHTAFHDHHLFADSKRPRRCSAGHSPSATPMDSR